jgi:hypothetical protein
MKTDIKGRHIKRKQTQRQTEKAGDKTDRQTDS